MVRYRLRLAFNFLVGCIPTVLLRGFLKAFESRQELAERAGYNVYPRTFYSPIPFPEEIDHDRLDIRRELPGIVLDLNRARNTLQSLRPFAAELDDVPFEKTAASPFWFSNASFTDFDAAVLHTLLRWLKPRRYVEVGCGFSSLISSRAIQANIGAGAPCQATYIDPEPRLDVREHIQFAELLTEPVQNVSLDRFRALEPGDVLFIDTSHVLKLQGDVEYELAHILPALKPGVWVHLHDIFTPYDYPEDWLSKPIRFAANEQYALECLLSGGDRFRVELPLYCLWKEKPDALRELFPRGVTRPHSFWIQRAV